MRFSPLLSISTLLTGVFAASRTSPPAGALVVAKSGGQFSTLQAAIKSISTTSTTPVVIFIQPGTYKEQVLIEKLKAPVTVYGYTTNDQDYGQNQVLLTFRKGADEAGNNDASGTLRAKSDNLRFYNINVENSRGKGVQAIAASVYGNKVGFYGCQFKGYQDTVLSNDGNHYFHKCYIEGATDFIFGQRAIAWFEQCTMGISGAGYITANGRDSATNPSYYVINGGTVKAVNGVGDKQTVLGRPWREYARVVVQNVNLGAVVKPEGWQKWGDNPTGNVYYAEFGNTGAGASGTRVSFAKKLSKAVTQAEVLKDTSWIDASYVSGKKRRIPEVESELVARQSDCSGVADGFASLNGGTTGGAGGTVVTVTTQADLEKYAKAAGKHVIKIKGVIAITPKGKEVSVSSDKTIVGIGSNAEINGGGFNLQNVHNVIFRNLRIGNTYVEGDEEGKTHDWDAIQMDTCSNIWIDHCHLEHGGDGLIDSRKDTTFLTVSWTIFRKHNKAFGIGWTDNVSSQITIHHNWFDQTTQRNPSADNIKFAHLYNNYLVGSKSYGHYARGKTEMRMENCYFESVKNPITVDDTAKLAVSGNVFKSVSGTNKGNQGTVFKAGDKYSYKLDSGNDVPSIVKAGAGRQASVCPA